VYIQVGETIFSRLEMTESRFKPRIFQQFDGLRYLHIVVLLFQKNKTKKSCNHYCVMLPLEKLQKTYVTVQD